MTQVVVSSLSLAVISRYLYFNPGVILSRPCDGNCLKKGYIGEIVCFQYLEYQYAEMGRHQQTFCECIIHAAAKMFMILIMFVFRLERRLVLG